MISVDRTESETRVAEAVRGSGADFGAVIDAGGERLTVIDDSGHVLSDDEAVMAFLQLSFVPDGGSVALPVTASVHAQRACAARGIEVVWSPLSNSGLLQAAASGGVAFASDRRGGYAFPAFLPAFDAAAALACLVALLEQGSAPLSELVAATPTMPVLHDEVPSPPEQKGVIMRTLMEQLTEEGADLVLVDGIKVRTGDGEGWVLVVPDPEDPVTHVWAEAADLVASERLAASYVERIMQMMG
jgi:mannose-1-phosphate guanylyltransferase/phosphomannomutase